MSPVERKITGVRLMIIILFNKLKCPLSIKTMMNISLSAAKLVTEMAE